ncbi:MULTISPECIES: alpha-amylase family glycosyl hydrolase [Geobacter]|uniref:alpha-amylase family glycosyl hydrolase n=1 Tax=Geobacter TaxID=28231 RepID=UPI002574837D|nr:alpha-amylase family glycosyl hydrolase [Geobacter sulfurreducens]BEH11808.1 alpha-amylase family glycosyl hydrolase [Geobacter sulfurreducens subsp. ethanolicus]BET59671.1 alpha-amylase family glycosyl hydrolase [Geobacter sp. 60473]
MSEGTMITGMGAIPHDGGVAFRVWAPHAERVSVIGSFNGWDGDKHPLQAEENGYWYADVAEARVGHEYKFLLTTEKGELQRIDPYARQVTNSVGNAIVHDPGFDWQGDEFRLAPWNELVIYELHVGTFNEPEDSDQPGQFSAASARLGHLKKLGVNAIQIMPVGEFAGDRSWGYNPAHIFSVEVAYGGPLAFKRFVKRAHQEGIGVILDVVYNHLGPSDLDLWQFDGWSENDRGGIYFYNDDRAVTPWGETRPDYGRGEVRQYILDNVFMWLTEYRVDGIRFDCTQFIRTVNGVGTQDLPEGWSLLQWINGQVAQKFPGRITIAEDLQHDSWITRDIGAGGAGFSSQWDAMFVHPIRLAVTTPEDEQRSLAAVRDAICYRYNDDAFDRVIYSESHDEVANGKERVPQEINPNDPKGWYARKRSTLAAAMVFTAPGIPMLFQGQEFLEGEWFRDTVPLDWDQKDEFHGIVRLYRDLIRLRLNRDGFTRGLCGQFTQVYHLNEERKVIAFHRWDKGGPTDDVVVVANFFREPQDGYVIGFPAAGTWKLRFNSDWHGYSDDFQSHPSTDVVAEPGECDGFPFHAVLSIGPYSVLIFSQ